MKRTLFASAAICVAVMLIASATAGEKRDWLDTTPVRKPRPMVLQRSNNFSFRCQECHKDFKTPLEKAKKPIGEHRNLRFDHGLNLNCLSCHHPVSRNVYRDHDFSEIPSDKTVLLCRKCHGPVYRDWEAGIHGRLNGSWDKKYGQQKLACNQCHDPHAPAFQTITPMPPPHASRLQPHPEGNHHE